MDAGDGRSERDRHDRRHLPEERRGGGRRGDPFEGLLFRITPTQALKIASRVSNLLLLNEAGSLGAPKPGEPVYIIGSSIRDGAIGDLKAFSEARARKTEQIQDLENLSGREITLGLLHRPGPGGHGPSGRDAAGAPAGDGELPQGRLTTWRAGRAPCVTQDGRGNGKRKEPTDMKKIVTAVKRALSIRSKDRSYGWWGYHQI
jgi:hypothetical protein